MIGAKSLCKGFWALSSCSLKEVRCLLLPQKTTGEVEDGPDVAALSIVEQPARPSIYFLLKMKKGPAVVEQNQPLCVRLFSLVAVWSWELMVGERQVGVVCYFCIHYSLSTLSFLQFHPDRHQ